MCTVSWRHEAQGYQLCCNRDEVNTRQTAFPPAVEEREGVRFIAPLDPDRGGTWIALNESGLTVCLLNGANLTMEPPRALLGTRSRGWLVPRLAAERTIAGMVAYLETVTLEDYSPFTLVMLGPGGQTRLGEWDGWSRRFEMDLATCGLLSSSSFDSAGARRYREEMFRAHVRRGGSLAEFHGSHGEGANAYSPCMHRTDAETVSFSRVEVGADRASLFYAPGPPCLGGESCRVELRLLNASAAA